MAGEAGAPLSEAAVAGVASAAIAVVAIVIVAAIVVLRRRSAPKRGRARLPPSALALSEDVEVAVPDSATASSIDGLPQSSA